MFRCEKMACCDMFLKPDAAFDTVMKLGYLDCVQFADLNADMAPFLKNYIAEVCRCAEIERKLRYVESEMIKDNIQVPDPLTETPPVKPSEMGLLENLVGKWESDIIDISENQVNLRQDVLEMKEMRYVLNHVGLMLGNVNLDMESILARGKTGAGDVVLDGKLNIITGVVKRTRSYPFQMMLWRISRGNIYYREAVYDEVLQDPTTGMEIRKVAFLVMTQGEMLMSRLQKVLSGFRVNTYPCPRTRDERDLVFNRVQNRIDDLEHVLNKSNYYRCRTLRVLSRKLRECIIKVRKAKAIYHVMNLFTLDITKNCLIGQCWLAERNLTTVQSTLESCTGEIQESRMKSFISKVETNAVPPTAQNTNKFTYGFQALINAYGDAKYGEMNPGLFTVITFPFLFAVMFGDSGHALIILGFAIWMIVMEKEFTAQGGSEIWKIFFGGRYVMLLLGLFSLFTGFIYNEVFSKSFLLQPSMWKNTIVSKKTLATNSFFQLGGLSRQSKPYIYGMDPIWQIAKNKIMISNSIKMKMSIIIGVVHMMFGIIVSIFNHTYFKRYYLLFLQFIPEFVFLTCIFFWLVIMIYVKWFNYYDSHADVRYGSSCAPQILILFIDMFLFGSASKAEPEEGCVLALFDSQTALGTNLFLVAIIMVPILLFGSPLYIFLQRKRDSKRSQKMKTQFRDYQAMKPVKDEEALEQKKEEANKEEEAESAFSDVMIHQAVHTIEYVLSTISHTASYLRLWALSLAHSQLSEMLWEMILSKLGLHDKGSYAIPKIFFVFPVWAGFTIAILVVMEGLSSFLHTLRLHWVEFMSKFYIGGGTPFRPFSFADILSSESDKSDGVCSHVLK